MWTVPSLLWEHGEDLISYQWWMVAVGENRGRNPAILLTNMEDAQWR